MNLILIRHARPDAVTVQTGRADPSLCDAGHEQAALLAIALNLLGVDALYSSPLRRALETAAPTAAAMSLDVVVDDNLVELDSGMSTYAPDDEIDTSGALAEAFLKGDWSEISSESPDQFVARARAALDAIVQRHRGETVAVFTHGGVISAWIASVVGAEEFPIKWFLSDYGAMNRFVTQGTDRTLIKSLNEQPPG